jgi:hypothetical protein
MVAARRLKALEERFKAINPENDCLLEFKAKGLLTELEALKLKGITPDFSQFYKTANLTPEQVQARREIRTKYHDQPALVFEELYA